MKDMLKTALALAGLSLALAYVATYFASVRACGGFALQGQWGARACYLGLPDSAETWFAPLHWCDETVLRPGLWRGTVPREEVLRAADAALKAAEGAMRDQ